MGFDEWIDNFFPDFPAVLTGYPHASMKCPLFLSLYNHPRFLNRSGYCILLSEYVKCQIRTHSS